MSAPHIVIIGGGFAGMAAAHAIGRRARVSLIDGAPCFEFLPNIHEIVSGRTTAKAVQLPRDRVLKDLGHAVVESEARRIDAGARVVETEHGDLSYDALVVATGGEHSTFGVPGAAEHAVGFRSAAQAETIAARLRELARASELVRVVIVGGGFTGVEVLGEMLRRYGNKAHLSFAVVEASPRLMSGWPKVLHRRVSKLARREGVRLELGRRVTRVDPDVVTLDDGRRLASALTVWATGTRGPRLLRSSQSVRASSRGIPVNRSLNLYARPEIFVAGDAAAPPQRVKKQAAQALSLGRRAGLNALRWVEGRRLKSFRRERLPVLLTFGDSSSFLVFDDDTVVEGPALAVGRDLAFQGAMGELDRLSSKGGLRRLERRMRHAKTLESWWRSPLGALVDLEDLRIHD